MALWTALPKTTRWWARSGTFRTWMYRYFRGHVS
jgi:hypothetical protein